MSVKPSYPAEGDGVTVRLACCIPHCRRTFRNDKKLTPWPKGSLVICGKHWRTAPADLRQRDRRLRRLARKAERLMPGRKQRRMCAIVWRWHRQTWDHARTIITERALGIA